MRNLVVVIALGVALLVFSVVAIIAPRDARLRAGDVFEPYVAALVRGSEYVAEEARDAAKRLWNGARRLVETHGVPGPALSPSTGAIEGQRSADSSAEEGTDDVAERLVEQSVRVVERGTTPGPTVSGRASVIDGDTLSLRGERIRLFGIDAPESAQSCRADGQRWRCGERATHALAGRIGSHTVACEERDRDRYGRIVALCRAGGEDLNAWMVEQGWALAYRRFSRAYANEERAARAMRRGIWRGDFVAPWDWRTGERLAGAAAERTRDTRSAEGNCRIKGNISKSGKRIYHVAGGAFYESTRVEPAKGERWFCGEREARAAGWRKSKR